MELVINIYLYLLVPVVVFSFFISPGSFSQTEIAPVLEVTEVVWSSRLEKSSRQKRVFSEGG